MGEATIEDLAFPNRSLRESDAVGRRVCIEPVWKKGNSEGKKQNYVIG